MRGAVLFVTLFITLFCSVVIGAPAYEKGTCLMWGDPHFTSFDGVAFDFQGKGWHTIFASPNVEIKARYYTCNQANVKGVTCTDAIKVYTLENDGSVNELYASITPQKEGHKVDSYFNSLVQYNKNNVPVVPTWNGKSFNKPSQAINTYRQLSPKLKIKYTTNSNIYLLTIVADGNVIQFSSHTVVIKPHDNVFKKTCGICGTYNQKQGDDFYKSNWATIAVTAGNAAAFGNSWATTENAKPDFKCKKDPTKAPTKAPTKKPTTPPTKAPTKVPTKPPTKAPTEEPTPVPPPTTPPTAKPTKLPTKTPPTEEPTESPTKSPTKPPSPTPTKAPTKYPTGVPTPTATKAPTDEPTAPPTKQPTVRPTKTPTVPPTEEPSEEPTAPPTKTPTKAPTKTPTGPPTEEPTERPTEEPTEEPTEQPTDEPTEEPTDKPSVPPTEEPTIPDLPPTERPTATLPPTEEPTDVPTEEPTEEPTIPGVPPTEYPTDKPTDLPTDAPTDEPEEPTEVPVDIDDDDFSPPADNVTFDVVTKYNDTEFNELIGNNNETELYADAISACNATGLDPASETYRNCLFDVLVTEDTSAAVDALKANYMSCATANDEESCRNNTLLDCPFACNAHGSCVRGTCECFAKYEGEFCEDKKPLLTAAETAGVITAGAVAGIAIAAGVFFVASGYGAKKGYDYLKNRDNKMSNLNSNPLYQEKNAGGTNPFYSDKV